MTTHSKHRGHSIYAVWFYSEDDTRVADDPNRPCGHCGKPDTIEGHDGCLGTLPGVSNACCGHGVQKEAYIQYEHGIVVRGASTIEAFERLKNETELER